MLIMKTFGLILSSLYFTSTGAAETRDKLKRKELARANKRILYVV